MASSLFRRALPLAFTVACGLWAMVHGVTSLLISKPDFPWPPLEEFIAAATGASSEAASERA